MLVAAWDVLHEICRVLCFVMRFPCEISCFLAVMRCSHAVVCLFGLDAIS